MKKSVCSAILLVFFCLAGSAFAATGGLAQSSQDLAQLKAAIFQGPAEPGTESPTQSDLIGKLSPKWHQTEDCSGYVPCGAFQCNCRNRCAPCGGVQQALCFNVCDCVNPGC